MNFNLKKIWTMLLLSIPFSLFISFSLLYFIHNGFDNENYLIILVVYFTLFFKSIKFFIFKYLIIIENNHQELNHMYRADFFYKSTGEKLFKHNMPLYKSDLYIFRMFGFFISASFTCFFFIYLLIQNETNNIVTLFSAMTNSIGLGIVFLYLLFSTFYAINWLFFEHSRYIFKRKINNNQIIYIDKDNNFLIFKNNKLHSEYQPAFFSELNIPFYKFNHLDKMDTSEIFDLTQMPENKDKGIWYINGEKLKNIDNLSSYEDIRKHINKIRTKNIAENF